MVRDVYAFFPVLMKYTDLHRAKWLKSPTWESDGVYENVAVIFKIWSLSQHFKREELNYMAQFEDDSTFGGEMKTGKAAIAERKKKRRETTVWEAINSVTLRDSNKQDTIGTIANGYDADHSCY